MNDRGRDRFDRSRYVTRAQSNRSSGRSSANESDDFYSRMRMTEADAERLFNGSNREDTSFSARLAAQDDQKKSSGRRPSSRRPEASSPTARATGTLSKKRIAFIAIAVALVIGVGSAFAYITVISNNLHAGIDDALRNTLVHTDMANEPFYILLLGTDASAERDENGDTDGIYRSDSMMLGRVDVPNKKVTLISISRDILVDMGRYGEQKINAAYAFGGAALAVQTVSKFAGVPISHYAEVNFDGFQSIVDALGGVEVDVPIEIDDWMAGGKLSAGPQTLNGEQALILCRSRNAYADTSARPDDMRAANQRLVLSAIAKKALASDIGTIASTVQAMSKYVTTDLSINDIIGLAQAMRGLDPDNDIYTASVPCQSTLIDEIYYDFVDEKEWKEMMTRVDKGEPPYENAVVDETTGTVLATAGAGAQLSGERTAQVIVKNGTDTNGLATSARKKLMEAGYANVMLGDVSDGYDYPDTLVLYNESGRAREAEDVVSILGQGKAMKNDGSYIVTGCDVLVIIGDDWKQ